MDIIIGVTCPHCNRPMQKYMIEHGEVLGCYHCDKDFKYEKEEQKETVTKRERLKELFLDIEEHGFYGDDESINEALNMAFEIMQPDRETIESFIINFRNDYENFLLNNTDRKYSIKSITDKIIKEWEEE